MNKNIFRAIRRQCRDIFENFLSEKSLSNSKVKGVFLENLMLFSDHLLNETDINIINIDGFSKSDFIKYLGLFINYCIMKKELMMTKDFKMAIETNDLLYSYSHKKFKDYLSIPEVNAIVKIIFERTDEDDFVNSQEALSSDPRAYKSQIQRIKENILAD